MINQRRIEKKQHPESPFNARVGLHATRVNIWEARQEHGLVDDINKL